IFPTGRPRRAERVGVSSPGPVTSRGWRMPHTRSRAWPPRSTSSASPRQPAPLPACEGRPLVVASLLDRREGRLVSPEGGAVPPVEEQDLVRPVHDRMPVIVPPASYAEWLEPQTREARLV